MYIVLVMAAVGEVERGDEFLGFNNQEGKTMHFVYFYRKFAYVWQDNTTSLSANYINSQYMNKIYSVLFSQKRQEVRQKGNGL
jgi:hypothetical protein